jgi:hypothetical protein
MFWINELLSFMMTLFLSVCCVGCGFFPIEVPPNNENEIQNNGETQTDTLEPSTVPPTANIPLTDAASAAMQNAINNYLADFNTNLAEWTPSSDGSPRVRVDVTNMTNQTYNWVILDIAFLDNATGAVVKTASIGAKSELTPNQTASVYVSGIDINNVTAYVYNVENNHFVYDEDGQLVSK